MARATTTTKPKIINQLAQLLQDPIYEVRFEVALAIGEIGSAARTPLILDRLARLLEDPISEMRYAAA